jgi:signal transduction histidine kinase
VPDGSGIGLYAARGLLEAMGGSIRLEGAPGTGTTARIRMPAEPIPADEG